MRSPLEAFRRRVGALDGAIPPGNSAQATTHVRLVPKLETTSVKYVENGLLWVKWSAFWANRSQARCVDRM